MKFKKLRRPLVWMLNLGIGVYLGLFAVLMVRQGIGFEVSLWGIHISANDAGKTLLIAVALLVLRGSLSMDKKNLLLLVASLLFSAGLAEVALRIAAPPMARQPSLQQTMRPSARLGWELVPGISGTGRLGNRVEINSRGLRDIERPLKKPADVLRILALGDSYTFGVGVDLEETYVKQIQSRLSQDYPKVDVINAGVAGYNLFQALTWFKEQGRGYHPDAVIYFFFLDDVKGYRSADQIEADARAQAASVKEKESAASSASGSYLVNFGTNLFTHLGGKFRSFNKASWLRSVEHRKKFFLRTNRDCIEGRVDMAPFGAQLDELNSLCRQMGAPLLVVAIPDAVQVGEPAMQKIFRRVETLCLDMGIPFLDITPNFEKQTDPGGLYLFPLDAHTSARGNRIIASVVAERIGEMLAGRTDSG